MAEWTDIAAGPEEAERMVAGFTGRRPAPAATWRLEAAPVALDNMTTAALTRVRGGYADGDGEWAAFVKTVRPATESPLIQFVPPQFHAMTLEELPWRAEVELYASEFADLLPGGLRAPALLGVAELGPARTALWLEDVAAFPSAWSLDDYRRAAELLGRLAGRAPQRVAAGLPVKPRDLTGYFAGRVTHGVLPGLADPQVWEHPGLREHRDLGPAMARLAGAMPALLERMRGLPRTLAHGDACPQNLLRTADGALVAIDWAFVGLYGVGYDLAQLIAGRAESGELGPGWLEAVHEAVVPAYLEGMRAEGAVADEGQVRLGYEGALVVRSAFTALPQERLGEADTAQSRAFLDRRVAYARFLLEVAGELTGVGAAG